MTQSNPTISPLRQCMIDDMALRKLNLSLANSHFKQPPKAEIGCDNAFPISSYGDQ